MKGIVVFLLLMSCAKSPLFTHKKEIPNPGAESSVVNGLSLENGYSYKFQWTKGPLLYDESELILLVHNSSGALVDPSAELNFQVWMPSMGHGSSVVKIEKISRGIFQIKDIYLIMSGYWELQIEINNKFRSIGSVRL